MRVLILAAVLAAAPAMADDYIASSGKDSVRLTQDAWHQGQGYRAGRDMQMIVHHREHGEVERHRVDVGMVQ